MYAAKNSVFKCFRQYDLLPKKFVIKTHHLRYIVHIRYDGIGGLGWSFPSFSRQQISRQSNRTRCMSGIQQNGLLCSTEVRAVGRRDEGGFLPIDFASFNTIVCALHVYCAHLSIWCVNLWTSVTFTLPRQARHSTAHPPSECFQDNRSRRQIGKGDDLIHVTDVDNGQRLIQCSNSRQICQPVSGPFPFGFFGAWMLHVRESDT